MLVIEHDMRVVAGSDCVIDMGPGAGGAGGRVVVQGDPRTIARHSHSRTASCLRRFFNGA